MHPKPKFHAAILVALAALNGAVAHAGVTVETVTVGNPGNAADTTGYGAVAYTYQIGKYEVTNAQYAAFLNAAAKTDTHGLYNANMGSTQFGGITQSGSSGSYTYAAKGGFENKPVSYVSFWDAARFANWLNNGQGGADTETGGYTLTSEGISSNSVSRNAGANWVVASEHEWYKAAYYDPMKNGGAGGYWEYAMQNDVLGPNTDFTHPGGANYFDGDYANGGYEGPSTTDVGTYVNAHSYYGTFDQSGNVSEWTEEIRFGDGRVTRGGLWDGAEVYLGKSGIDSIAADASYPGIGFRVVSLVSVPEPSAYASVMGGFALTLVGLRRKRRASI